MTLPVSNTSQTLYSAEAQTQFSFTLTYQRGTASEAFIISVEGVTLLPVQYTIEEPVGEEGLLESFTLTLVEPLIAGQTVKALRVTEASQNTALVQGKFPNEAVENALDRIYMLLQENRSVVSDNASTITENESAISEIEVILDSLSDVAFSGDYEDLINAPNLSTSLFSNVDATISAYWTFNNDITVQGVELKGKTDINEAAILFNAQNISDNAADISSVESSVLTNSTNITLNTNEIDSVKADYANKTSNENITGTWSHAGDLNAQFFVGDGSKLTNLPITGDNILNFKGAFGAVSGNDLPVSGQANGDSYICDSNGFLASDGKTYNNNDTAIWSDSLGDFYKVEAPASNFAKVDENEIISGNWNFSNDIIVDGVLLKGQADTTKALAETNEADIIVLDVAVGANAANIAANSADIATNTANIAQNTLDIASIPTFDPSADVNVTGNWSFTNDIIVEGIGLKAKTDTNETNIGTNTTDIATAAGRLDVIESDYPQKAVDETVTGLWSFNQRLNVVGIPVPVIYSGAIAPDDLLGEDGDVYIQV